MKRLLVVAVVVLVAGCWSWGGAQAASSIDVTGQPPDVSLAVDPGYGEECAIWTYVPWIGVVLIGWRC